MPEPPAEPSLLPDMRLMLTWNWPQAKLWRPRRMVPRMGIKAGGGGRSTANPVVRSFHVDTIAAVLLRLEKYRQWRAAEGRCAYCGREFGEVVEIEGRRIALELQWDHFKPVSAGGKIPGNLRPSCHLCNAWKTDYTFRDEVQLMAFLEDEWAKHLAFPPRDDASTAEPSSADEPIGADAASDSVLEPAALPRGRSSESRHRTLFRAPRVPKPEALAAKKSDYWATCKEPFVLLEALGPGAQFEFYAFPGEIVTLLAKTIGRAITTPHHGETVCSLCAQVVPRPAGGTPTHE